MGFIGARISFLFRLGCPLLFCAFAASADLPPGVTNTQAASDRPLSPVEAVKKMTLPEGFTVTLFAGEPNVHQPIAFDFDDRGRLWVVECFSYPDFKPESRDRVVIFEDKDNDGVFDERKVFLENGHRLTGIVLGFGGVWLCSAPNLIFVPDKNGDDVPDGKAEVRLDGFTLKAGHNMVNGLAWGPDGWLYGRHGITAASSVGKPGTPDAKRTALNCSIWRYHPVRQVFEVVAHGTTNPWGLDWDEHGQPFFSNNVIGHLWHLIPGARYQRMFGEDMNPHTYALMRACSDHLHWAGKDWTKSRGGVGEHNALGGGHSHSGAMIYLGGSWPERYRDTLMMANIHGNRLLFDKLERYGSGYSARHGDNFLLANDTWFRAIHLAYGPDGGVFVTDWNDLGECHDSDGAYRASGRIYKIAYGTTPQIATHNVAGLSDTELIPLLVHKNEWYARHARRVMQERAVAGKLDKSVAGKLRTAFQASSNPGHKLRYLWALHVIGEADEQFLNEGLGDQSDHVRWWSIQLLAEPRKVSPEVLKRFEKMAATDGSPLVLLSLASVLQRLPLEERWGIAAALAAHGEEADDQNIPLMLWYGIEPAVPLNRARALQLMRQSKIPVLREFISRRLAAN